MLDFYVCVTVFRYPFPACDLNHFYHATTTHPLDKICISGASPRSPLLTRRVSIVFCNGHGHCDEDVGFFSFLRGCCYGWTCTTADLIIPCGTGYYGSGLGMRTLILRTFVDRYSSLYTLPTYLSLVLMHLVTLVLI